MSRLITLDVDSSAIHVLLGASKGNAPPKVEKAATFPLSLPLGIGNAVETGKNLKEFLRVQGMAAPGVLVCVGRDRVILKDIKYPNVPVEEEANIVRFQVSKELTESSESYVIDYFPLDGLEPDGQKKALTVALKKDYVESVRIMCENAGLKLNGIVPRAFALGGLMQKTFASGAVVPPQSPQSHYAVLTRGERWGEMAIYKGSQVVFSRALTGPALNAETAFLGEVKRNLTVFASQSPGSVVEALYLPEADQSGTWGGRLRAGLTIPVHPFDPLAGLASDTNPQERGNFAGLVGVISLGSDKTGLPVNFISPRQPILRRDPNKRALGFGGIAVGLLVVGSLLIGYLKLQMKEKELVKLRGEKSEIKTRLDSIKRDREREKAVEDWRVKSVNWLDELYDLAARFPNIDNTQLTKLTLTPADTAQKNKVEKFAGKITMNIQTASSRDVENFKASMLSDSNYDVMQRKLPSPTSNTGGMRVLNQLYEIMAEVKHRLPKDYLEKLTVTPPTPSRSNGGGNFNGFGFGGGGN
ncbi:hypothetical protein KIH39_10815 [Telmatocola sphagniphila]|uniref:Competence protein A n=1 Tax=Telmatocola sphagniphila TaxID=1123043 RepID=A0A8E6EV19_9BACT|nr:hypothetical protein [Telmatocola sphagniphila]QVL34369.1 hypothetical protein KIH39_10815 [Telmatocola sphagniphila]